MTSLYEHIARTDEGSRALASARLRREVLKALHRALKASGLNQVDLAKRLGVRKSAVNQVLNGDGNVRITTLAEYLHAAGQELQLTVVAAGQPREQVLVRRSLYAALGRRPYRTPSHLASELSINNFRIAAAEESHIQHLVTPVVAVWAMQETAPLLFHSSHISHAPRELSDR